MNRRIIAGAAALVMVMGGAVCPAEVITESFSLTASAEDYQQEGDIYYEVFKGGKYIVVRGLANADAAEVVIPDKIDGVPVTVIGEKAFSECEGLTSVTLPETIENIETGAFDGCTALAEINFPSSLKSIGDSAFENTGLKSIDLPEGLETIGTYAFFDCPGITFFTIPKSVKEIGDMAIGCYYDGNGIYKRYSNFLIKCYSNTAGENYAYDGWFDYDLVDPDNALNVPVNGGICNKSFRYEIVEGGNRIKVTSGHKRLSEIEIPAQIGDIPVTEIGEDAFNEYENLTKIDIPATVDTFGNNAFCDCTNLTEIKIPKATKTIGDSAFNNTGLKSIDLPEGLETIGTYAFFDCPDIKVITIPKSVKEIGDMAIGCYYYGNDIYKRYSNFLIKCYSNTAGENYAYDGWFDYDLVDPDNALNVPVNGGICNKSFRYEIIEGGNRIRVTSGHKGLSEIEIPAQIGDIPVTEIGEDAFNEYENLTKIDIPATVDTFGNNAFCDCTNLTEIKIPKATKTIGDSAFDNTGLTEVDLPEGLETIGSYAFFSNEKMTAVDIPLSVKEIGEKAFGYDSDDYKSDNFYITCFEDTAGEDYMKDNGFDGNVKQQPYLRGDINNDHTVTVTDISMAAGHVKAIKELNEVEFKRADVSGDDVVNVTDISMIAAHVKAIKEL